MKCSYCSTQNSSLLHEEINKFGEYPLIQMENATSIDHTAEKICMTKTVLCMISSGIGLKRPKSS